MLIVTLPVNKLAAGPLASDRRWALFKIREIGREGERPEILVMDITNPASLKKVAGGMHPNW
jgi:hypothetical protein